MDVCLKKGSVKVLTEIKEALKGSRWYICGGTLLGAVRAGALIPWRACLNVGIIGDPDKELQKLRDVGFEIKVHWQDEITMAVARRRDAYVDVIVCKDAGDGVLVLARKNTEWRVAKLPKKFFEKMGTAQLGGVDFPTPGHVEEYLELKYGNWKVVNRKHNATNSFTRYIIDTKACPWRHTYE